jgi:hypothetical protein
MHFKFKFWLLFKSLHPMYPSYQNKIHHITTSFPINIITQYQHILFPLTHSLPVATSELGTDAYLLSATAHFSFENDHWPLLYDDLFSWRDNADLDCSSEDVCLSLSEEDCEDLECDMLREGQHCRHKLFAMTRFWWSSCGNRPVTWCTHVLRLLIFYTHHLLILNNVTKFDNIEDRSHYQDISSFNKIQN